MSDPDIALAAVRKATFLVDSQTAANICAARIKVLDPYGFCVNLLFWLISACGM